MIENLPYRPCAGLCIVNGDGLVFAGKRLDFVSDAWQMPQGGIDKGETASKAAIRELTEETGIAGNRVKILAQSQNWLPYELPQDLVGKLWGGKFRGQRQKWFCVKFLGDDSEINIVQEHQEFSEWKWMKASDVLACIVPFKRDIYTNVFTEFERYLAQ